MEYINFYWKQPFKLADLYISSIRDSITKTISQAYKKVFSGSLTLKYQVIITEFKFTSQLFQDILLL